MLLTHSPAASADCSRPTILACCAPCQCQSHSTRAQPNKGALNAARLAAYHGCSARPSSRTAKQPGSQAAKQA